MAVSDLELLQQFERLRGEHSSNAATHRALAIRYNLTSEASIRKRIARARKRQQPNAELDALRNRVQELEAELARRDAESGGMYYDDPPEWDDTPKFRKYLETCRAGEYRVGLLWPDLHFPDHNDQAIALGDQLERVVKPDFNMIMGDIYDLDGLGKFGQSRRRKKQDVLEEVIAPYHRFIERRQYPTAAIMGNHDGTKSGRMARALDDIFAPLAKTIEEAYVDIIRAGGRVWYLGGMNEIKLNSIILQHGTRTGEYAAKNALKDRGFGLANVGVHTHFPSLSILSQDMPGEDDAYRVIMSAVLGTLSNRLPHYQQGTRKTRHIHCMGVATFSLRTWVANVELVVFHPAPNGDLVAFYGGHILTEPAVKLQVVRKAAQKAA